MIFLQETKALPIDDSVILLTFCFEVIVLVHNQCARPRQYNALPDIR